MKFAAFGVALVVATLADSASADTPLRIGHFNIRELDHTELDTKENPQAKAAAQIIQKHAPDILSINEMSYDIEGTHGSTHTGRNIQSFQENYLGVAQNAEKPIDYPYSFFVQGNSGVDSGQGFVYGFGRYVGQYNMAVYSKYPIRTKEVRRFHTFPWKDLPSNIKPETVSDAQRLFDKDFWDIPIEVGGRVVHLLMCHAVVPVFDETNDERNFDTLRFIKDYVEGNATYATPDGGMKREDLFVVVGDLNADPDDGESRPGAVQQLLDSDRILVNYPEGDGRDTDGTPPDLTSYNTTGRHFLRNTLKNGIGDTSPGGFQLQLDYLLPSKTMRLGRRDDGRPACGVFWSRLGTPEWALQRAASDHHFVWTDVIVPAPAKAGEAAQ